MKRWLGVLLLAASAAAGAATPWWAELGDPLLDTLMQNAGPAGAEAEQRLAQDYIALRVGHLRVRLADGMIGAAHNEQALWMSAPIDEQRDAALAAVGRRLATVEEAAVALRQQRQQHFDALAAASGLEPTRLQTLLAPALAEPSLPAPVLPPQAAKARVPEPLAALADQARRVAQGQQWVASRQAEWQAREQRLQLGGDDAIGTLQAYQQYVVDADQLAQASGSLALDLAKWLQSRSAPALASRR